MTEPSQRTEELASRLRRLLGPTEVGPQTIASVHWETMPRWNEPDREYTRAGEPTTVNEIRAMSREPAVQLNLNVGSAAGGKIKGIEGVIVEMDPDTAVQKFEQLTRAYGSPPTLRRVAAEMLEGTGNAKRELLEGPAWAGSKRGWIEPGEAARAVTTAATGQRSEVWNHVNRKIIDEVSVGEDYDAYLHALAEDRVSPEHEEDQAARDEAVGGTAQALHEAFRPTLIDSTATVHAEARISTGARIGANALVEKEAVIGENARIGQSAIVGGRAVVHDGAEIGRAAVIGIKARVHDVGEDSIIGRDTWCQATVGKRTHIGQSAMVEHVGDDCRIGEHTSVGATVGDQVQIGTRTEIGGDRTGYVGLSRDPLKIPDGSAIGDEVNAPHGWQQTDEAVDIDPGTRIGKDMAIPPLTRVSGKLETPADLAKALNQDGVPKRIGKNCRIDETAELGAGCRIKDNVTVGSGARIGAGATVGEGTRVEREATVGIAASLGTRNIVIEDAKIGDGARTGEECFIAAELGRNARTGDRSRVHGRVEQGAVIGDDGRISNEAVIGPKTTIGDRTNVETEARVGAECEIGSGVTIAERAEIGEECSIENTVRVPAGTKLNAGQKLGISDTVRPDGEIDLTGSTLRQPAAAPRLATGEARTGAAQAHDETPAR